MNTKVAVPALDMPPKFPTIAELRAFWVNQIEKQTNVAVSNGDLPRSILAVFRTKKREVIVITSDSDSDSDGEEKTITFRPPTPPTQSMEDIIQDSQPDPEKPWGERRKMKRKRIEEVKALRDFSPIVEKKAKNDEEDIWIPETPPTDNDDDVSTKLSVGQKQDSLEEFLTRDVPSFLDHASLLMFTYACNKYMTRNFKQTPKTRLFEYLIPALIETSCYQPRVIEYFKFVRDTCMKSFTAAELIPNMRSAIRYRVNSIRANHLEFVINHVGYGVYRPRVEKAIYKARGLFLAILRRRYFKCDLIIHGGLPYPLRTCPGCNRARAYHKRNKHID